MGWNPNGFNFTLSGCMTARAMMKRVVDALPWVGGYGTGDPMIDTAFDNANAAYDNPASIGVELPPFWKFWDDGPTYCEGSPQMTEAQAMLDALYNAGSFHAAATDGPKPGEVLPGSAGDLAKKAKKFLDETDWGFWLKALVVVLVILAASWVVRSFRSVT